MFDYIKTEEVHSVSSASQPASLRSPDEETKTINKLQEIKTTIMDLIEKNQLNEIVNTFVMQEQLCSTRSLKSLYRMMQNEVVKKFGAPLSPSLFPETILMETPDVSSGQRSSMSQSGW